MDNVTNNDAEHADEQATDKTKYVLVALAYVAAIVLTAIITHAVSTDHSKTGQAVEDQLKSVDEAPGMPLDAIQYQNPAWMPDAKQVFEVTDRVSNASWWVIRTSNDQWVTLPISGGGVDAG